MARGGRTTTAMTAMDAGNDHDDRHDQTNDADQKAGWAPTAAEEPCHRPWVSGLACHSPHQSDSLVWGQTPTCTSLSSWIGGIVGGIRRHCPQPRLLLASFSARQCRHEVHVCPGCGWVSWASMDCCSSPRSRCARLTNRARGQKAVRIPTHSGITRWHKTRRSDPTRPAPMSTARVQTFCRAATSATPDEDPQNRAQSQNGRRRIRMSKKLSRKWPGWREEQRRRRSIFLPQPPTP